MKKTVLFAPQIDAIIEGFNPENNTMTLTTYLKLKDIYNVFSYVKSRNDDEIHHTWIEVERGPVEAFGDYEEFTESGEVESPEEIEQLWREYYPDKTKWYKFQTARFQDNLYFYFNEKLLFSIKQDEAPANSYVSGDGFPDQFADWLQERMAAHPWEICRGGNSTHISLFISEVENNWALRLAGSSIFRVEETVRMAVALFDNKIPFQLSDAEEIVRMVTGSDFIGIVPDAIFPRYCYSLFPKEDKIIDFMNIGFDKEIIPKIIEKTYWYPLEKITLFA
jgi:hypothetical protein